MIRSYISQPVYYYNGKEIECRIGFTLKSPYLRNIYKVKKKRKKGGEEEEEFVLYADKLKERFPQLTIANNGDNYHVISVGIGKAKCNEAAGDVYDQKFGKRLAESRAKLKVFSKLTKIEEQLKKYLKQTDKEIDTLEYKHGKSFVKELFHLTELEK